MRRQRRCTQAHALEPAGPCRPLRLCVGHRQQCTEVCSSRRGREADSLPPAAALRQLAARLNSPAAVACAQAAAARLPTDIAESCMGTWP